VETDRYVIRQRLDVGPEAAEERIRAALADEGFGVLTEIDVRETLRAKLDVEVAPYRILGACKPMYALRAIELDPAIGGLLPCNVVVRAHPEGGSELIAVDPEAMLSLSEVEELTTIAARVREELARAVATAAES
jgi:uncharacterized protein (DUF302 family)